MIVRSGSAASFLVMFSSGHPDGNISWKVRSENGTILASGSTVVPAEAVSINIGILAIHNTLGAGILHGYRDVEWTYTVAAAVVNGESRYTLEARLPYGVSPGGVRNKLGIDKPNDLPDSEIALVTAYLNFEALIGDTLVPDNDGGAGDLAIKDAIESLAALALIPAMQVRVAIKESSGTNSYQRDKVDWLALAGYLEGMVTDGILVITPTFDVTAGFGSIFILAGPAVDPLTGATV